MYVVQTRFYSSGTVFAQTRTPVHLLGTGFVAQTPLSSFRAAFAFEPTLLHEAGAGSRASTASVLLAALALRRPATEKLVDHVQLGALVQHVGQLRLHGVHGLDALLDLRRAEGRESKPPLGFTL